MSALRASIARLPRFAPGTLNIGEVAEFVHMHRPMSMRALIATIDALPESVPFHSKIVTGTALGGEVTVTLGKDGSYRSSGFMRATGALSFSYRITAIVRSASGGVMVATVHSGKVFGSDTPGERQSNWNEIGVDQDRMKLIRNAWPDICAGKLEVRRSTELGGVLGRLGLEVRTELRVRDVGDVEGRLVLQELQELLDLLPLVAVLAP